MSVGRANLDECLMQAAGRKARVKHGHKGEWKRGGEAGGSGAQVLEVSTSKKARQ
jgi:hypothetical protein